MLPFPKQRRPYRQEESDIQCRIVLWLRSSYPDVIFTISPIVRLTIGQAIKMNRLGYRKATPDLMIFKPMNQYHGLFIEIKTLDGTISPEQKEMSASLNSLGYCSMICRGYDQTFKTIDDYLKGKM